MKCIGYIFLIFSLYPSLSFSPSLTSFLSLSLIPSSSLSSILFFPLLHTYIQPIEHLIPAFKPFCTFVSISHHCVTATPPASTSLSPVCQYGGQPRTQVPHAFTAVLWPPGPVSSVCLQRCAAALAVGTQDQHSASLMTGPTLPPSRETIDTHVKAVLFFHRLDLVFIFYFQGGRGSGQQPARLAGWLS